MKHTVKISNVTELFDHQRIQYPDFYFVWWYRYDHTFDTDTAEISDEAKQLVDKILIGTGFPDYAKIAYFMIKYAMEKILVLDGYGQNDDCAIAIVVSEQSIFAKGNDTPDETGFVKLFTLFFKWKKLVNIQFNANVMYPKVPTRYGPKEYQVIEPKHTIHDNCSICNNEGDLVNAYCGHTYHLDCLRNLSNFSCPMCNDNLINFLKEQGVSDQELADRIDDGNMHEQLQEHLQMISTIDLTKLDDDYELLKLTPIFLKTLKLSNGDVKPLHDITVLQHSAASIEFNKVAVHHRLKGDLDRHGPGLGIFVYYHISSLNVAVPMLNTNYRSVAKWYFIDEIEDTPFKKMVQEKLEIVGKSKDKYVMGIIIDDTYTAHIIHKDDHKNALPITYVDRVRSVLTMTPYQYTRFEDPIHNDECVMADIMSMTVGFFDMISHGSNKRTKKRTNKRKINKRK